MLLTQGYAAMTAKSALQPFSFERREVGSHDVCSFASPTAASATRIFIKRATNGAAPSSPWYQAMKSSAPWHKSGPR